MQAGPPAIVVASACSKGQPRFGGASGAAATRVDAVGDDVGDDVGDAVGDDVGFVVDGRQFSQGVALSMLIDQALRALADALEAGMTLQVLAEDPTLAHTWPPPLRTALRANVKAGVSLGTALLDSLAIDDGPAALIDAGEVGGFVPRMLRLAADHIAQARARRRRTLGAVAWPAFLLSAGAVVLPLPLLVSEGVGAWAQTALPGLLSMLSLLGFAFVVLPRLPRTTRQQITAALIRVPVIGTIVVEDARAACFDVLGALLGAGASMPSSLAAAVRAADLPSSAQGRFSLWRTQQVLERGSTLAEALVAGGFVDDVRAARVALAERTGTLERTLPLLAKDASDAASRRFTTLLAVVGTASFLAVAGLVGLSAVRGMISYVHVVEEAGRE